MFHGKSKKIYGHFFTRKDYHHQAKRPENALVWYDKKKHRKYANRRLRHYNGYFANGDYKKIFDVQREVL